MSFQVNFLKNLTLKNNMIFLNIYQMTSLNFWKILLIYLLSSSCIFCFCVNTTSSIASNEFSSLLCISSGSSFTNSLRVSTHNLNWSSNCCASFLTIQKFLISPSNHYPHIKVHPLLKEYFLLVLLALLC